MTHPIRPSGTSTHFWSHSPRLKSTRGLRETEGVLIVLSAMAPHYFRYHRQGHYQPHPPSRKYGLKTKRTWLRISYVV
jgi:hypothetical protein